jgi:hypothetical protein
LAGDGPDIASSGHAVVENADFTDGGFGKPASGLVHPANMVYWRGIAAVGHQTVPGTMEDSF